MRASCLFGGLWLLLSAAPAAATIDLVGTTAATFAWSPGSGPAVAGYIVGLSLNSGSPILYQTVTQPRVTVHGGYGDVISIAVVGFTEGTRVSPPSEFSEPVRFVAAPDDPPPPGDPPPPPAPPGVTSELWFWNPGTGSVRRWEMNGVEVRSNRALATLFGSQVVVTAGDFDSDGDDDLLVRDAATDVHAIGWIENGFLAGASVLPTPPPGGTLVGAGLVDDDGYADLIWEVRRNGPFSVADVIVWYLTSGAEVARTHTIGALGDDDALVGTPDLRADGTVDLLVRDERGLLFAAIVAGDSIAAVETLGSPGASWLVAGTPDLNGDGLDEILLRSRDGDLQVLFANGLSVALGNPGEEFSVAGTPDLDGDGWDDLLIRSDGGVLEALLLEPGEPPSAHVLTGNGQDWIPLDRYRILPGP